MRIFKRFAFLFAAVYLSVFSLTGCARGALDSAKAETEAYTASESNEEISSEEQEKEERKQREKIAQQYSDYEKFGLTYDKEKDRFFYAGEMVRYFNDQISSEHANSFFYEEGKIDLEPKRNKAGKLTGLKQISDSEFAMRTKKYHEAGIMEGEGSYELGDPDYQDDSLKTYQANGISFDRVTQRWNYNGQPIHALYDAGHLTFLDADAMNGISVQVIRDEEDNIKKLVEMSDKDTAKFID